MKFQKSVSFIAIFLAACSSATQVVAPIATSSFPVATSTPPTYATLVTRPCQPIGYPQTIHFENGDSFGDGFISRIRASNVRREDQEEILKTLVTQWLDHYKTQSLSPSAAIKDYSVDQVNLLDPSCDHFFQIVAGVRFSIIPSQVPNDYTSFPGDAINPDDVWWHLSAPFGVFRDGDDLRLRLVFGWGT